jgi:hypothetical protein
MFFIVTGEKSIDIGEVFQNIFESPKIIRNECMYPAPIFISTNMDETGNLVPIDVLANRAVLFHRCQ